MSVLHSNARLQREKVKLVCSRRDAHDVICLQETHTSEADCLIAKVEGPG